MKSRFPLHLFVFTIINYAAASTLMMVHQLPSASLILSLPLGSQSDMEK